jgi:hypothetical protein
MLMDDETNLTITYTQIASCVVGSAPGDQRRLSLRARLERERQEHSQDAKKSFITTLRNLFTPARR